MRIFVTGATGVIGCRVVPLLVAAGHQVTAVGRSPEKQAALERQGAKAVAVDLFAADTLPAILAGHDTVINLATSIPPMSRIFLPGAWNETTRIRKIASANLVDASIASGVTRFIQESFAPIYPDCGDQWIDESAPLQPSNYNRSVLDAEASAERFTQTNHTGIVLRFAAFYGDDPQTKAIIDFVRRGWSPLVGSPDAYFSAVSHDDAATAVVAALSIPAGTYNVVDDEPLPRRESMNALAQVLGVAPPKFFPAWATPLFGPMGDPLARSLRISNRKLRGASNWTPKYPSVREGWRAVVEGLRRAA